jgi:hypothetical protein
LCLTVTMKITQKSTEVMYSELYEE